jgi:hypothetical protein
LILLDEFLPLRLVDVIDGNVHDFELELFEVTDNTPPSFIEPIDGNVSS